MLTTAKNRLLLIVIAIFSIVGNAQEDEEVQTDDSLLYYKLEFYNLRGTNVIDAGLGMALITGDFQDPELDMYLKCPILHCCRS